MNILINLYNQTAAGPKNISLNLITELQKVELGDSCYYVLVPDITDYSMLTSSKSVHLIKLPKYNSFFKKIFYRLYLELFVIPNIIKKTQVKNLLAFGNFLLTPLFGIKKTVLLHHTYLFDDELLKKLAFSARIVEKIKRLVFWFTLKNIHTLVVQSSYVNDEFNKKWSHVFKGKVVVIENPISSRFSVQSDDQIKQLIENRLDTLNSELILLYVSRFYPHKNHKFLIELSAEMVLKGISHQFLITVDERLDGATQYLSEVKSSGLPIINLGEIKQEDLESFYTKSHVFIFPSESETFGNPLVEAMSFGLPVVVPDLGYAHSIVGGDGIYYRPDCKLDCTNKIIEISNNRQAYLSTSIGVRKKFESFSSAGDWALKYIAVLS